MGLFSKNTLPKAQKNMRFSANRALTLFKSEGQRTERVEEYIQHTRTWAKKVLEIDPDNEEAKNFENFPDSTADHLDNNN